MLISARNTFFGTVSSIRKTPLLTEVCLDVQDNYQLVSVVTSESFETLALAEGDPVTALVKAPEVLIGKDDEKTRTSARNSLPGRITSVRGDGVAVEIMGVLDGGTPMCAIITAGSEENLALRENDPVWFFFKAFNVILSAE